MTREEALNKIRKLLARADANRNDNEHERETAMRQAMALMNKFGLDVSDAEVEDEFGPRGASDPIRSPEGLKSTPLWERSVWESVARLYDCKTFSAPIATSGRRTNYAQVIVGREMNRETVELVGLHVIKSIHREAGRTGTGRAHYTSFGVGASYAIAARVQKMLAERRKRGEQTGGRELMVVERSLVEQRENDEWMAERFGRMVKGRGLSVSDNGAARAGYAAGQSAALTRDVGGAGQRRIGRG